MRPIRLIALIAVLLAGCAARVEFTRATPDTARMTANTRLTAEYTHAADGAESWRIDTSQVTTWDRIRSAAGNLWNYLGRKLDNTDVSVED